MNKDSTWCNDETRRRCGINMKDLSVTQLLYKLRKQNANLRKDNASLLANMDDASFARNNMRQDCIRLRKENAQLLRENAILAGNGMKMNDMEHNTLIDKFGIDTRKQFLASLSDRDLLAEVDCLQYDDSYPFEDAFEGQEILNRLSLLRKENEELKAQNLLIRGDNADLLAKADAYSFNLSNMNASIVELRKDNDHNKYYDAYHELKDAAISLVQRLELDKDVKKNNWWLNERAKIMEVVSKESEASHE